MVSSKISIKSRLSVVRSHSLCCSVCVFSVVFFNLQEHFSSKWSCYVRSHWFDNQSGSSQFTTSVALVYNKPVRIPKPMAQTVPMSPTCMELPSKCLTAATVIPSKHVDSGTPIKSMRFPMLASCAILKIHILPLVASVGMMPSVRFWHHPIDWVKSMTKSLPSIGLLRKAIMFRRFLSLGDEEHGLKFGKIFLPLLRSLVTFCL